MTEVYCRTCDRVRDLKLIGYNSVGRPKWECPEGHTQIGPFPPTSFKLVPDDD